MPSCPKPSGAHLPLCKTPTGAPAALLDTAARIQNISQIHPPLGAGSKLVFSTEPSAKWRACGCCLRCLCVTSIDFVCMHGYMHEGSGPVGHIAQVLLTSSRPERTEVLLAFSGTQPFKCLRPGQQCPLQILQRITLHGNLNDHWPGGGFCTQIVQTQLCNFRVADAFSPSS